MTIVIDGTNGISGVDGTASNPSLEGTDSNTGVFFPAADTVAIGTGGTERLRVDSAGNAGLGVTPSAWRSGAASYDVLRSSYADDNGTLTIASNAYRGTSNWIYKVSTFATRMDSDSGQFRWYNAPSGTAGNTITFTQAMTLDASGNLGIGTNTPGASLQIAKTTNALSGTGNNFGVYVYPAGSGICYVDALTASTGNTDLLLRSYNNGTYNTLIGSSSGGTVTTFQTGGTERARIDASGFTQFNSNLVMPYQGAPTSKSGAGTLSGAELITGILNTTGTTYTITLPTGTNIEGALTWSANNVCLDWFVINTASGTITIGANSNTTLGSLTVATGTTAHFRIRRTAANTFTVYRL